MDTSPYFEGLLQTDEAVAVKQLPDMNTSSANAPAG
jgi:hypothetical protein